MWNTCHPDSPCNIIGPTNNGGSCEDLRSTFLCLNTITVTKRELSPVKSKNSMQWRQCVNGTESTNIWNLFLGEQNYARWPSKLYVDGLYEIFVCVGETRQDTLYFVREVHATLATVSRGVTDTMCSDILHVQKKCPPKILNVRKKNKCKVSTLFLLEQMLCT